MARKKFTAEIKTCRRCDKIDKVEVFTPRSLICKDCTSLQKKTYYIEKIKEKHPKLVGRPKTIKPIPEQTDSH